MTLEGLPYRVACAHLEAQGYALLTAGDWARVFVSGDGTQVARVTPFDPAYRLWAEMCQQSPHPTLPRYDQLVSLAEYGYAVFMPRYLPGDLDESARFLADVTARLDRNAADPLTQTLQAALDKGFAHIPYFAGIDDNPHNVLRDGETLVWVDGFFQRGAQISADLAIGVCRLNVHEVEAFGQIPYFAST